MKAFTKFDKIIKLGDIEFQNQKFHQHKEPTSIKNVGLNKIVVFNKVYFVKRKYLNDLLATKMLKN